MTSAGGFNGNYLARQFAQSEWLAREKGTAPRRPFATSTV
jgi:hypothetical protein